jgi:hypothetical protein
MMNNFQEKSCVKIVFVLAYLLFLQHGVAIAQSRFGIRPTMPVTTIKNNQQIDALPHVSSSFRLKEFSPKENKEIETEVVTFHLYANPDNSYTFQMNCAKPVALYAVVLDMEGKEMFAWKEKDVFQRMHKSISLQELPFGQHTLNIYNETNTLLKSVVFEKYKL